jgi:hypothetical protein
MTGKITNINDYGTIGLMLRDSGDEMGLQCYPVDNADADKASIGRKITVEGTIRGGELWLFMVADDCCVVELHLNSINRERCLTETILRREDC